jgi:hypothetical protein
VFRILATGLHFLPDVVDRGPLHPVLRHCLSLEAATRARTLLVEQPICCDHCLLTAGARAAVGPVAFHVAEIFGGGQPAEDPSH